MICRMTLLEIKEMALGCSVRRLVRGMEGIDRGSKSGHTA